MPARVVLYSISRIWFGGGSDVKDRTPPRQCEDVRDRHTDAKAAISG